MRTTDIQITPGLMGVTAINPDISNVSAARAQMLVSHITQIPTLCKGDYPVSISGVERRYGEFTFKKKIPCTAKIVAIIDKHPKISGIRGNPNTVVIYQNLDAGVATYGCTVIDHYHSLHPTFGFEYNRTEAMMGLFPTAYVEKNTILADSPAIDKSGNYTLGVSLKTAFMSLAGVAEDALIISESASRRLRTKCYSRHTKMWGKDTYPLNLYGDDENYKPHPDIGEYVGKDGLLMAFRTHNPMMAPVEMSRKALQEFDVVSDDPEWSVSGGKVVDVIYHHSTRNNYSPTPLGMDVQAMRYYESSLMYYKKILSAYQQIKAAHTRGVEIELEPTLHDLVVEAMTYINETNLHKQRRRVKLDDWAVTIVVEYDYYPGKGGKLTGLNGDKGIISLVWPDHWMPVNEFGERVDLITCCDSTLKRMNPGRLVQHGVAACAHALEQRLYKMFGMSGPGPLPPNSPEEVKEQAWQLLLRIYKIASPLLHKALVEVFANQRDIHLNAVLIDKIRFFRPVNNPVDVKEMISQLRQEFPPNSSKVTWMGRLGEFIPSEFPVTIGEMYVVLLEKNGNDFSGVSSATLQPFGLPAKVGVRDRHAHPCKRAPVRVTGEAEVNALVNIVGPEPTTDLINQSNDPAVHKAIVANICRAANPTNIAEVVDRTRFPTSNGRNHMMVKHQVSCAGAKMVYSPEDPS